MLSFERALGFGVALLGLSFAPSVSAQLVPTVPTSSVPNYLTLGNSVVTVNYATGPESIYFGGDGSSASKPVVGVLVDYPAGTGLNHATTQNKQTILNGAFEFVHSVQGAAASCCYPYNFAVGVGCQPDGTNKFSIPAQVQGQVLGKTGTDTTKLFNVPDLLPNVPTQIKCINGNSATSWVLLEAVSSLSGMIQGELSWLIDGPAPAVPAVVKNNVTITPAIPALDYVVAPVLSQLKINAAALTGLPTTIGSVTTPAANPDGPTGFVQAVDAVNAAATAGDGVDDGAKVDPTSGLITWTSTSTSTQFTDTTSLLDVIGCAYQPVPNGPWVTVNDKTHWKAPPVGATNSIHYNPQCFFNAVSSSGVPQQVSVSIDVGVQPPCAEFSATLYKISAIDSVIRQSYQPSGSNTQDISIFYNDGTNPKIPVSGTVQLPTLKPTSAAGVTYPFYSMLSVASESEGQYGIMTDPIGYYSWIKSQPQQFDEDGNPLPKAHPVWYPTGNPSNPTQGYAQTVPAPAGSEADVNHALLCQYADASGLTASGDFNTTQKLPLANDLTLFAPKNTYYIHCTAWDYKGTSNQVTLVLPVLDFVDSGNGGCSYPSICGDPQFAGFLGQSYQVHGVSGMVYNILSTPSFQYNALFSYLSKGECRSGTQCFSHPGNYFGEVGMLFKANDATVNVVRVVAGPVKVGLAVYVNDVEMAVSASPVQVGDATLTLATPFELQVEGVEFSLRLSNSDMFINQDVAINSPLLREIQQFKQASKAQNTTAAAELQAKLPHGLLGQTWEYKTYQNRWKYIQGTLFEYSVADGITGTQFKYNRF